MAKKNPDTPQEAPEKTPTAEAAAPEAGEGGRKAKGAPAAKGKPEGKAESKPAAGADAGEKKKNRRPGAAPHRGKKLRGERQKLRQKIAKEAPAPLQRAVALLKQIKRSKFDETVEVHMSLGIDATQSDQMIRGSVSLPHGVGKAVRVVVFCQGDNIAKAKEAGADHVGAEDLIKKIQTEGWTDFDMALATQDMMAQVSRLGKVLGPRGLMPSPKAGTVITAQMDLGQAVREFKAGKVEYRSDKTGNVHAGVGKISFDEEKLVGNITAFVDQIRAVKPSGVKGNYIRSITIASTMSPGVPVSM